MASLYLLPFAMSNQQTGEKRAHDAASFVVCRRIALCKQIVIMYYTRLCPLLSDGIAARRHAKTDARRFACVRLIWLPVDGAISRRLASLTPTHQAPINGMAVAVAVVVVVVGDGGASAELLAVELLLLDTNRLSRELTSSHNVIIMQAQMRYSRHNKHNRPHTMTYDTTFARQRQHPGRRMRSSLASAGACDVSIRRSAINNRADRFALTPVTGSACV